MNRGKTPFRVIEDAPLKDRNTFRVAARCTRLIELYSADAIEELLARYANEPVLPIGEGSNMLFVHDYAGSVLILRNDRISTMEDDGDLVRVRAEAGVAWNALVGYATTRDLRGIENLALIPGKVGAAPIQNIGAYGVELADSVHCVEVWDRTANRRIQLTREQCRFAYRDSCFKREPLRWIVLALELRLQRSAPLRLDYSGVREELATDGISNPSTSEVADAISAIRRRKLPDPNEIGNAGSFFKNPLVEVAQALDLRREYPSMPIYRGVDTSQKLSAAWLIEACGLKGLREGDAGVSAQHALVLVNYGWASGAQLWALAQIVRERVRERFGILLEIEPVIV
jgi:UDP-N-acetylmuramate dehydrogenase